MKIEINYKRIPHAGEIELCLLCLCGRCASTYYSMNDHGITRVDINQTEKDVCTLCGYRLGYDFYVWPKSNVEKETPARIRTFVEDNRDE